MSPGSAPAPAAPPFSWSHSRDRLLGECPRAYFWRYYGSHRGWLPDAPAEARNAWRLRHLVTLHTVFGQSLHGCARDCATAARDGRPIPSAAEIESTLRRALRAACAASRDRASFYRKPKDNPMLHSVFYRAEFDDTEVEVVRGKLDRCAQNLHHSTVWDDIAALPRDGTILVEALSSVVVDGVQIYAAPDLVTRGPGAACTVIDWKSGRRVEDDQARAQLALYAWFVERKFGFEFREGQWIGRAIYLDGGEEERHTLTRVDLMRAGHRIAESVEEMRRYIAEPDTNHPKPKEAFPLVHPALRFRCPRCSFNALCAAQLAPGARAALLAAKDDYS